MDLAAHSVIEDKERTANSAINNDPHNVEDAEIFYKPYTNAAGHCGKWDCPIHKPVEQFIDEWRKAKKKTNWYFLGLPLTHEKTKKLDKLMHLRLIAQYLMASSMITMTDNTTMTTTSVEELKTISSLVSTLSDISNRLKELEGIKQ